MQNAFMIVFVCVCVCTKIAGVKYCSRYWRFFVHINKNTNYVETATNDPFIVSRFENID